MRHCLTVITCQNFFGFVVFVFLKNSNHDRLLTDFGMTRDIYETDYYRKGGKGRLVTSGYCGPHAVLFSTSMAIFLRVCLSMYSSPS